MPLEDTLCLGTDDNLAGVASTPVDNDAKYPLPLLSAAMNNSLTSICFLLLNGAAANIDGVDSAGDSALHHSANSVTRRRADVSKYPAPDLRRVGGGNFNELWDKTYGSATFAGTNSGPGVAANQAIIKLLKHFGATVDLLDHAGYTPLFAALSVNNPYAAEALLRLVVGLVECTAATSFCSLFLPIASYCSVRVFCSCLDALYTLRDATFHRLLLSHTVSRFLQPV